MKALLPATLACLVIATPVQAQSRYDICSAYARDAMTAFHSSSAVPASMVARARGTGRRDAYTKTRASSMTGEVSQTVGSLKSYFDQCMAR